MKKMGRPSTFTQETADRICARIADGESLRNICKDAGMPHVDCVRKWLRAKPDFVAQYARARQEQADHYADEIIEIADDQSIDPNARRVQIEARKWIACKLKPKAYGDRADVTLSGALEIRRIENVIVDPVSDDS